MENNPKTCAYAIICKGNCDHPSSCVKHSKSEEEYWKEIQEAMVAVGRLRMIQNYVSKDSIVIRRDIIQRMATPSNIHAKCPTCDGKGWVYEYYSQQEEPPKMDCPSCKKQVIHTELDCKV